MITLCYHRIGSGKYATELETFKRHLSFLKGRKRITLSFDDATSDFYHTVFPLLKEHGLKALLAVPTFFISSDPDYCTWGQLREISKSGLVEIASHSHTHPNLTHLDPAALEKELTLSKRLLWENLGSAPEAFVFPYGQFDKGVKEQVLKHYKRVYRLGSALNLGDKELLYRIVADGHPSLNVLLSRRQLTKYFIKSLIHQLRAR